MPLVSVIIPTFNRKGLLERAVRSVLEQTFSDYEVIVVDDGSNDRTDELSILKDPSVTYIRLSDNGGVSRARNTGVRYSSGKWIAFLDSDDEWFPQKLEKQVKWTLENQFIFIVQTREVWVRNGKRVNPPRTHEKFEGDLFCASLERCMITPSSVMLTRVLFEETGPFNESLPACEDYDLWLRITCKHPIGLLDEYLLKRYGGHDDQLSSKTMGLDRFRIRSLLDLLGSNDLNEHQRNAARSILVRKAEIVANGYLKRGNITFYEQFKSIAETYR